MKIELDRTQINKDEIPSAPYDLVNDGKGYEYESESTKQSRKEMKYKKKVGKESINLNIRDGLRLAERFINKYFGYLIGNNENPILSVTASRLNIIYIVAIIILTFFLIIK